MSRTIRLATQSRTVDVLDVSDLRFPGGTSHSVAEEIKAQADAGWSTGLVQLNGSLVSRVRAVNPLIRAQVNAGRARLLVGRDLVAAKLVVVRHPAVLQTAADQLPRIDTDKVVIVANAAPHDVDGHEHYRPEDVHAIARERFGIEPIWAPIGPLVRAAVAHRVPAASLRDDDWVNIIDVDAWWSPRTEWRADRPVIGRHSRDAPQKWPRDPAVIRAVYPTDGSAFVRVLGGAGAAIELLGELPENWQVLPFGARPVRDFLADLDFFVYYHDPRLVEAFGRTILEAMASGVPAILPPHFQPVFGDAATYAEPYEVAGLVQRLRADRTAYDALVEHAAERTRTRFNHGVHRDRIEGLIGPPTTVKAASERATITSAVRMSSRPAVLFITSNGAGMGHLTRLMAYARRTTPDLAPHFLSLSQAVGVASTYGFPYEYLPSTGATGMAPRRWHDLFTERVSDTVTRIRPAVIVFDGTWPYEGIRRVRAAFPEPRWVWSRRGMWKAGKSAEQLLKETWFDAVIEPGDFAAPFDVGVTAAASATRIGPVTLLDRSELEDRAEARRALGLDPDPPMALVSLGAGNINDTRGDVGAAATALRRLGVEVCVTVPAIAESAGAADDLHVISDFPLSRRFHAFDLAISAAGYNSFHELLRFGVPTLLVPNRATALDDQEGRARFAAERGLAHRLDAVTVDSATPLLQDLLQRGQEMAGRAAALDPGNGAIEAADHLRRIAAGG
ncbi:MAG TPA: glycosyltransferase [Propionibacteriaceae bacterium]|nr:glycosyltransferase [Propionibacteriaceae bacterium]